MNYVCSKCGKSFERKKPFEDGIILCNSCLISKRKLEAFQDPEKKKKFLEKSKQTNIEKYGVPNVLSNSAIYDKGKKARIEKHGYAGAFQNTALQDKIQQAAHSEEAYKKKASTYIERYGVDHFMKSKEGNDRFKSTLISKYGVDNIMKSSSIDTKRIMKSYYYDNINFDSSWELAYYIWLKDSKTPFEYQPKNHLIPYTDYKGINHVYRPDFLVNGMLVEIKGDQFFNEKGEPFCKYTGEYWWDKYNTLIENKVIILRLNDIKYYLKYVSDTYGKAFLREHKIKHINKNRM